MRSSRCGAPHLPAGEDALRAQALRARRGLGAFPELAVRYPRPSIDRESAETHNLKWVTPAPPFEAHDSGQDTFAKGACFHSLAHDEPPRLDFYRARAVDGMGQLSARD